jgi:hypothetical protein
MSRVTNLLILAPHKTEDETPFLRDLNRRMQQITRHSGDTFVSVHDLAGGPKLMEGDVFLGTTIHTELTAVVQVINDVLKDRTQVYEKSQFQLFVKRQEDKRWTEVSLYTPEDK